MQSRTAEGKHNMCDVKFIRSINIPEAFESKEAAQAAIDTRGIVIDGLVYKIRQK